MNEPPDRNLLTRAAIGVGAVGLCCALPAIATLGVVALALTFGLGGGAGALLLAVAFSSRRRTSAGNHSGRTHISTRRSP